MLAHLIPALALTAMIALAAFWIRRQAAQRRRRARFIEGYRFPEVLRRKLLARHPRLDAAAIDLSLDALRQYFLACLAARDNAIAPQAGMPSVAADEAWHEFILMTRDYTDFCRGAFGGYLHHHPEGRMTAPVREALANTLHQLVSRAPTPQGWRTVGALPLLFAVDAAIAIEGGNRYDAGEMASLELLRRRLAARRADGDSGTCAGGVCAGEGSCGAGSAAACDAGGSGCGGGCGS